MQHPSPFLVSELRLTARKLVREFGFMNRTLAGTDLAPSAVHAVIEIGAAGQLTATELCEKLLLEKSTVSRLVKSLVTRGELREVRSDLDARVKHLRLSLRGSKTLAAITKFAEQQVEAALFPLGDRSRQSILIGIQSYAVALRASRLSDGSPVSGAEVVIGDGYVPGIIGRIVEMHASYYDRHEGFGVEFESKVAAGLAAFSALLGNPDNGIWYAHRNGRIIGSVAIDGEDLGEGRAHLRWFIVDDAIRGTGVGKLLMQMAIAFCDAKGFRETQLWTFEGLDAARRLYESNGFKLVEEYGGNQWGTEVLEQKFVRVKGG